MNAVGLPARIGLHAQAGSDSAQQYAGRLHRSYEGKRVVQVYDYVDAAVPVLARMCGRRLQGYKAMGYVVTGDTGAVRSSDPAQRRLPIEEDEGRP
ncbi:MAG TPA: hypothetical protein DDZ84_04090 [Firmicutes bacterium]|nr:hypothetical protein [Bacillota bacterium]